MSAPRRHDPEGRLPEPIQLVSREIVNTPCEKVVLHELWFLARPGVRTSETRLVTRAGPGRAHYFTWDAANGHLQEKWLQDPPLEEHEPSAPVKLRDPLQVAAAFVDREKIRRTVAKRFGGDFHLSEDAVQEAALRALERTGPEEVGNHVAYLVGVAKNVGKEERKARDKLRQCLVDDEREQAPEARQRASSSTRCASPENDLAAAETRALVWAAIAQLPQRCKESIVFVARFELKHEEAAALVGTSSAVMRDAVRRARMELEPRLRTLLSPDA